MLSDEKYDLLVEDTAVAIIPVYFIAASGRWVIPPLGLVIPSKKAEANKAYASNTTEMYGGKLPKSVKPLPLEAHTTDLLPEQASEIEQSGGLQQVFATAQQDCHDECIAIMGLVEVLSCANVHTETLPAPKFLNTKRLSRGKVPFYEFKVLTLDLEEARKSHSSDPQGTHSSPRIHLRRGHIRRLPDRSIFVRAAIVGDKSRGAVMKEYAIKPPQGDA